MDKPTLSETLGEFDAGIFEQKALEALKLTALGCIQSGKGKKGKVTIELELERIGESSSVTVKHTLKFSKPTQNGKATEENTTSTPMYVDNFGYLTISPQTQADIFQQQNDNVTRIGTRNG